MIRVTPEEFSVLTKYIYDVSGITLDNSKVYLIETRLGSLVEEFNCKSYSEFYYKAKSDATKAIEKRVVNAITTQETLWFRDKTPFEVLRNKIVPDLIDRKQKGVGRPRIRIWSAASSTGQEIYSIAMTLAEMLPNLSDYDIRIVGTDISDAAIAAASYAKYTKFEMDRGLTPQLINKYFAQEGDLWKINDEIRFLANFKKFNLFDNYTSLGKFDIVFCRNVAIYFTIDDRKKIFDKIAGVLEPGGCLLIGASEYLAGICDRFASNRHCRAVYYTVQGDIPTAPSFGNKPETHASGTVAPRTITNVKSSVTKPRPTTPAPAPRTTSSSAPAPRPASTPAASMPMSSPVSSRLASTSRFG
ncbi:CheR family methyltransferase [Planctomycetota bacterium]